MYNIKGTIISNDTIVATNSGVYGKFKNSNIIIGGSPARVIKDNISWSH